MEQDSSSKFVVALAVVLLQMTVSTVYYFKTFKKPYMRLVSTQGPVFDSSQLPVDPLRSLLGTLAACCLLTSVLNWLVLRLGVRTWQEGLAVAAVLLLIDACLNARHHFFEGRPLVLFCLHGGYHAIVLVMTCCLLAEFGMPPGRSHGQLPDAGTAARANVCDL